MEEPSLKPSVFLGPVALSVPYDPTCPRASVPGHFLKPDTLDSSTGWPDTLRRP